MPGKREKLPVSKAQARLVFARAAQGEDWAQRKVAAIHKAGPGSLKRKPSRLGRAMSKQLDKHGRVSAL
jgi:hypothetical protein